MQGFPGEVAAPLVKSGRTFSGKWQGFSGRVAGLFRRGGMAAEKETRRFSKEAARWGMAGCGEKGGSGCGFGGGVAGAAGFLAALGEGTSVGSPLEDEPIGAVVAVVDE